jgi:peptidoglycan hydrolase CwlO-like protein
MPGWFNRAPSVKGLNNLGDPSKIIEYMHNLEEELVGATATIKSLTEQIQMLKSEVSNKNAEIQHLQAVSRGNW